jgi:hypothetical protein
MKFFELRFVFLLSLLLLIQISDGLKTKSKTKAKPKPSSGSKNKNSNFALTKPKNKIEKLEIRVLQISEPGFTRFTQTNVVIPKNGEIVVGRDTTNAGGKLILQCSAPFPVQWIYNGDGV